MDYVAIFKRFWYVLRNNRAFWLIGLIQSLITVGLILLYSVFNYTINLATLSSSTGILSLFSAKWAHIIRTGGYLINESIEKNIYPHIGLIILILIIVYILFGIFWFISDIAKIKVVDQFDQSNETVNFWAAIKLGWSRKVWQLIGIGIVMLLIFMILGAFLFIPLIILPAILIPAQITESQGLSVVLTIAFFLVAGLMLLIYLVVNAILKVIVQFITRACLLEDNGVFKSISRGFEVFRKQPLHLTVLAILISVSQFIWGIIVLMIRFFFSMLGIFLAAGLFFLLDYLAGNLYDRISPAMYVQIFLVCLVIYQFFQLLPYTLVYLFNYTVSSGIWTLVFRQVAGAEAARPEPEAAPQPG